MANSKLHDDLVNEIEPVEDVKASVASLVDAIANRIEACGGDPVKLTDLKTILREDTAGLAKAVLSNTPAARIKTRTTADVGGPSPAFEKPREGVRQGNVTLDDKRDQVFPETKNTEAERERMRQEQIAHDRGDTVTIMQEMPKVSPADKKADDDAKKKTKELQQGKR